MSTATTINRNSVSEGDVITWRTRNGGHEARGIVQWATRNAVHVDIPGRGIYAVEWPRVETVTEGKTTRREPDYWPGTFRVSEAELAAVCARRTAEDAKRA